MKRFVSMCAISFCIIIIRQSDANNALDHTTVGTMFFTFEREPFTTDDISCKFVVLKGFIKETCQINNKWYYKCPFSNHYYKALYVGCRRQEFSNICPNDSSFYQSCGHLTCPSILNAIDEGKGVCGEIICKLDYISFLNKMNTLFLNIVRYNDGDLVRCDGKIQCDNYINGTAVDEYHCEKNDKKFKCDPCYLDESLITISSSLVCDDVCDCYNCFDESQCNNNTVGIVCRKHPMNMLRKGCMKSESVYIEPRMICDGIAQCLRGIDEIGCSQTDTCAGRSFRTIPLRMLHDRSKCAIPDQTRQHLRLLCDDYRDQMNCTGSQVSPLTCDVGGYPTSISKFVICKDHNLCDDNVDSACVQVNVKCKIHKHNLCDGFQDCPGGFDEGKVFCQSMTLVGKGCERKLFNKRKSGKIPASWIMDGIEDCMSGVDEDISKWHKVCGNGNQIIYSFKERYSCINETLFRCPDSDSEFLKVQNICTGFSNCDKTICLASRRDYEIFSRVKKTKLFKRLHYCLPGLESFQAVLGVCKPIKLQNQFQIYGVKDNYVFSSERYAKNIDCRDSFGEHYLYLVCSKLCSQDINCPLTLLNHSSCINYRHSRILSITDSQKLTVVIENSRETYEQNIFGCENNRCVSYDRVCDLVDDCGDESDEMHCMNNFKCTSSGEYIPLSKMCNGMFDCFDYSDECNSDCDNYVRIFEYSGVLTTACIVGTIVTVLNMCVILKGFRGFSKLKTAISRINNCFILVISSGDLLQGTFLLLEAISDKYLNESTCETQFQWMTNNMCTFLGVISTVGSLVSLYSMTVLSIIRAKGTRRFTPPREEMSRKSKLTLFGEVLGLYILAVLVAIIPIFPPLEDYFVLTKTYDSNRLFVGKLNKERHVKILEAYYGRLSGLDYTWDIIEPLINGIFERDHGIGTSSKIGFYESNGFCLFNYFSRGSNIHTWFSISVLTMIFICIITITICYLIVYAAARKSLAVAGQSNKATYKRNIKLQRKVSILILTDIFTWIPFLIVCLFNLFMVFDTSGWYSIFSVIILPLNSIVNPILIFEDQFKKFVAKMKMFECSCLENSNKNKDTLANNGDVTSTKEENIYMSA